MPILLAGSLLSFLGLACGAVLLAAPLGWLALEPGGATWALFPLFTLVGYAMLVVGSADPAARVPTTLVSAALLALSMLAAVALAAGAIGLLHAAAGATAPLCFVLLVGGLFGGVGSAAMGRRAFGNGIRASA